MDEKKGAMLIAMVCYLLVV